MRKVLSFIMLVTAIIVIISTLIGLWMLPSGSMLVMKVALTSILAFVICLILRESYC